MIKNNNDFLKKVKSIYGNKLDFSKSQYKGTNEDITVTCPIHGDFIITPKKLYYGRGCPKCKGEIKQRKTKTTDDFIKEAREVHGDKYDYSKTVYIQSDKKVIITCPIHGDFEQRASSHLSGCGCRKCGTQKGNKLKAKTTEQFINEANIIHNYKYDYSQTNYINAYSKVKIICPIHGKFEQTPNSHLKGRGCPKCSESKGEKIIEKLLLKNSIEYEHNFKIQTSDIIRKSNIMFVDFYLPKYNLFIEYNGKQHYEPIEYFGGEQYLEEQVKRDNYLLEYCKNNSIDILIIDYNKSNTEIEKCLKEKLS